MSTSQDQVNRLKRDLRLTKDKYEDLVVELESKERQLLQMEDVTLLNFGQMANLNRKEIDTGRKWAP